MSSVQDVLQEVINQMIRVVPFILLFFGTFGCLGNLITFSAKQINKKSCVFYFLCTAVFELLTLCFGLISRIADQFGSTLQSQNRAYCKIRSYLALAFPSVASYLLLMSAIDRCMLTSIEVRYRAFSQLKVAYRIVPLVFAICMIACSHVLFFVDLQPSCVPQPGLYPLFYSVFLISVTNVLPNALLLLFALWTIRNLKITRRRIGVSMVIPQQQRRKQKKDAQFVVMVIAQAVVSSAIDTTRMACYSYYLLTANRPKSAYQQIVDTFTFQFSILLSYFNYSVSFYIYTLTSALFRKVFRQTIKRYYQRLIQTLTIYQNRNVVHIDRTVNIAFAPPT